MLSTLDLIVLVLYAVGVVVFGLRIGKGQGSAQDYFLGGRDLPWWAVCFSIVATETSTLTVLSVPGIAYGGALVFLQLTLGYLIGRIVVAIVLLPRYMEGQMETAYSYLGERFGNRMRGLASVTFLLTRLLADGVRLYATAI
ncbi:MAG: sodium:solute symporter, partial [Bacteroidota bacterium]